MTFTLYTKSDCPLCDKAKAELDTFRRSCEFQLELIDITTAPAVFEKYKHDIPVLHINGREAARHVLDQKKLKILAARFAAK